MPPERLKPVPERVSDISRSDQPLIAIPSDRYKNTSVLNSRSTSIARYEFGVVGMIHLLEKGRPIQEAAHGVALPLLTQRCHQVRQRHLVSGLCRQCFHAPREYGLVGGHRSARRGVFCVNYDLTPGRIHDKSLSSINTRAFPFGAP